VWMSAFRFRDKIYRFVVNGRTGEVQGERPYSRWKIAFAILLAAALIGGGFALWQRYGAVQHTPPWPGTRMDYGWLSPDVSIHPLPPTPSHAGEGEVIVAA